MKRKIPGKENLLPWKKRLSKAKASVLSHLPRGGKNRELSSNICRENCKTRVFLGLMILYALLIPAQRAAPGAFAVRGEGSGRWWPGRALGLALHPAARRGAEGPAGADPRGAAHGRAAVSKAPSSVSNEPQAPPCRRWEGALGPLRAGLQRQAAVERACLETLIAGL